MYEFYNAAWIDRAMILDCTVYTLGLLFLGYFPGVSLGLVTGITFGYSEKARYWVNPVIKFFGPIPTSTWIPIMIAEMLGVKSGLGWYMNWSKSWASYDKMFAALFVIRFIFTVVTKILDRIKGHVLRWQNGTAKKK